MSKTLVFYVPPWGNFDDFTKIARMPENPAKNNNFTKMQNYQKKGWTKTKVFYVLNY